MHAAPRSIEHRQPDRAPVGARVPGAPARPRRRPTAWLLAFALAAPCGATLLGLPYYLAERGERVRSPLHAWLKASGTVGLAFGIAGLAMFLFMWLYPLRKKLGAARRIGSLSAWLDVHIVCGLALPLVVAVHAGWRFQGLIGLGYLSMVLVAASGIVGRYLYVHIPRGRSGIELTLDEAMSERKGLITGIALATRQDPMVVERALAPGGSTRPLGLAGTLRQLILGDFARWRTVRRLRRHWKGHVEGATLNEALRLARRELALTQQLQILDATRRVFSLWHVAHRPFAITALLAVLVHVGVAVAVGAVRFGG